MHPPGDTLRRRAWHARGWSLFEMLMAVAIVALLAAVALPAMRPATGPMLDAAGAEVLEALRHARAEAIRTGTHHGVRIDSGIAASRLRVFRYDAGATVPAEEYTVLHPLERRNYDIAFAGRPALAGAYVQSASFASSSATDTAAVAFDPRGSPCLLQGATTQRLATGSVTLAAGGDTRTVSIDAETGRPAWF